MREAENRMSADPGAAPPMGGTATSRPGSRRAHGGSGCTCGAPNVRPLIPTAANSRESLPVRPKCGVDQSYCVAAEMDMLAVRLPQ